MYVSLLVVSILQGMVCCWDGPILSWLFGLLGSVATRVSEIKNQRVSSLWIFRFFLYLLSSLSYSLQWGHYMWWWWENLLHHLSLLHCSSHSTCRIYDHFFSCYFKSSWLVSYTRICSYSSINQIITKDKLKSLNRQWWMKLNLH